MGYLLSEWVAHFVDFAAKPFFGEEKSQWVNIDPLPENASKFSMGQC
jgi:hypothetical protein